MKQASPCRCCGDTVPEIIKRFDADLGAICPACYSFFSEPWFNRMLRRAGIAGVAERPKEETL